MDIEVMPARLQGAVPAIPAKSAAHRALICAALADKPTRIACGGNSEAADIAATVACLNALGATITREAGGYLVHPLPPNRPGAADATPPNSTQRPQEEERAVLPCGESGSTFRFLLPLAGALGRAVSFHPAGRLPQRPLSPLYEELSRHGCLLSPQGTVPFEAAGQLQPGDYVLDAGISSQFISGLLFALPLLEGESRLRLSGPAASFPYIELTLSMLEAFGIQLDFDGRVFTIAGRQIYRSPGTVSVEGDWSNAACWLAAGALGDNNITCSGLNMYSRQGDRAIAALLRRFGADTQENGAALTVSRSRLQGLEIDAEDIPDLVPILAVVGAVAEGITVIRQAARLRGKESDRLAAITAVLRGLGGRISETADGLLIRGGAALMGGEAPSWGDHRIVMAAAIAATVCKEPVIIRGAEAVNKSYPAFFSHLSLLGGTYRVMRS